MANKSEYREGYEAALRDYAWPRGGRRYVGRGGQTLEQAIEGAPDMGPPTEADDDPPTDGDANPNTDQGDDDPDDGDADE